MRITTTKKLRGVIDFPSLGIQLSYNHSKNKAQSITIDDRHCSNSELQRALSLELIVLSEMPKEKMNDDGEYVEPQPVYLINKTKNPIMITINKETKEIREISPGSKALVSAATVRHPAIQSLLRSHKMEIDDGGFGNDLYGDSNKDEQKDEPIITEETKLPTAIIINPNNEELQETQKSMKNKKSIIKNRKNEDLVYTPDDLKEDSENDIDFVDKPSKITKKTSKRKYARKTKKAETAKPSGTVEVKAKQTKPLDGTTPVIMKADDILDLE